MEFREERAAIAEYDGGLPRATAEAHARTLTEQYRVRRARAAAPQPDLFSEPAKPSPAPGTERKTQVAHAHLSRLRGMLS